jgi:ribonuclease HI
MELTAVIGGLWHVVSNWEHPPEVEVVSDSAYVVNCFLQSWHTNWEKRGWKTSTGAAVKNQPLWRELLELVEAFDTTWTWVKGHAGHSLNELADEFAVKASINQDSGCQLIQIPHSVVELAE